MILYKEGLRRVLTVYLEEGRVQELFGLYLYYTATSLRRCGPLASVSHSIPNSLTFGNSRLSLQVPRSNDSRLNLPFIHNAFLYGSPSVHRPGFSG